METLPLDTSHPAVRDYLALVRLQVLTPISLLLNIATVLICATITTPNIRIIARSHNTALSPNPTLIAIYVLAIYLGQIGYCLLLLLASKPETKQTLTKAVGLSLVLANVVMALWPFAFILQWFLIATVLQGTLLLLLLYSNLALLIYHPPTFARPFDMALIHAPLRLFLLLPLAILFPYSLFITLGLGYRPAEPGFPPIHYSSWHAWSAFAVVMATNLVALLVVALRRDVVWCVAATWLCVSLWTESPKPGPVFIPTIVFTVVHPLALFLSFIYVNLWTRGRDGGVVLDGEDEGLRRGGHAHRQNGFGNGARANGGEQREAREIDEEAVFG